MEFWIILVLIAQFLQAIVVLIDKYLVTSPEIPKPATYAFYVGVLSIFPIVLVPFGVIEMIPPEALWLAAIAAATYISALLYLYSALRIADATDVAPFLGAVTATATFLLSFVFLDSDLPPHFLQGIALLVLGMLFVAHIRFSSKGFWQLVAAGILFAASAIAIKLMFNKIDFINAFFWSRMANVAGALLLLFWIPNIRHISKSAEVSTSKTRWLIIGNKVLSGFVFLLMLVAIKMGDVSVANALAALQFIFLFVIVILLGEHRPKYIKEVLRPGHILHKVVATMLIFSGFLVLFL